MVDRKKKETSEFPASVEKVFTSLNLKRNKEKFSRSKPLLLRAAIWCAAVFIVCLYFFLPVSHVRAVTISGTERLKKSYVRNLSEVTLDDRFFLCLPFYIEKKIESDPMIENADVKLDNGNVIRITVKEKKPVGYRYTDKAELIMNDGTIADLKSDYLEVIASLPLIIGFEDEEQTRLLAKALSGVNDKILDDISEISQYALKYDEEAMKILMRSGGYFIANYFNLSTINSYNKVYEKLVNKSQCLYASEDEKHIFSRECPWDETETVVEYWTDEEGNIIYNKYGDPAGIHYYTDDEGFPVYDAQGLPIVIPIDDEGIDIKDPDFMEHYEAGYYDSGVLILPDEQYEPYYEEESEEEETE